MRVLQLCLEGTVCSGQADLATVGFQACAIPHYLADYVVKADEIVVVACSLRPKAPIFSYQRPTQRSSGALQSLRIHSHMYTAFNRHWIFENSSIAIHLIDELSATEVDGLDVFQSVGLELELGDLDWVLAGEFYEQGLFLVGVSRVL